MLQIRSKSAALLLFFLLLSLIEDVKSRKKGSSYCNVTRHEFYLPAGDMCKRCDRCGPGLELKPLEISDIHSSEEHGALGCQICKRCDEGFFSKGFSYKPCKKCKDCEAKGKINKKKCDSFSDAKCGKKIPIDIIVTSTPVSKIMKTPMDIKYDTNASSNLSTAPPRNNDTTDGTSNLRYQKTSFVLLVIFVILIALLIVVIVIFYFKHYRNGTCDGTKKKGNSSIAINMETDGNDVNDLDIDGAPLVENQPLLVIPETFGKNEIPTERQLQFIARFIATNQCYRHVGITLGIPDNDISIIEEENSGLVTRAFKVLKKWTQKYADQASVYQLLVILRCEGRCDVVTMFMETFKDGFANQYCGVADLQDPSCK